MFPGTGTKYMGHASGGSRYDGRTKQYGDSGGGGPPIGQRGDSFSSPRGRNPNGGGQNRGGRESFRDHQGTGGSNWSLDSGRNPQANRGGGFDKGHQRGGGTSHTHQQRGPFNSQRQDSYSQGRDSYVDRSSTDRGSNREPDLRRERSFESNRGSFGSNQGGRSYESNRASFGTNQGGRDFENNRASFGSNQGGGSYESNRASFGTNQGGRDFENNRASFGSNQGGRASENDRASFGSNQGGRAYDNDRGSFGSNRGGRSFENNRGSYGSNQGGRAFENARGSYGSNQGGQASFGPNQGGRAFDNDRGSYGSNQGGQASFGPNQGGRAFDNDRGSYGSNQGGQASFGPNQGGRASGNNSASFGPNQGGRAFENDRGSYGPNQGGQASFGPNQGGRASGNNSASLGPNQGGRDFKNARGSFGPNQGGRAFENDRGSYGPNQRGQGSFGPNQGGRASENNSASFGPNQGGGGFQSDRASFGDVQGGENLYGQGGRQGGGSHAGGRQGGGSHAGGRQGGGSYAGGRQGGGSHAGYQARNDGNGQGRGLFNAQRGENIPHSGSHHGGNAPHMETHRNQDGSGWRNNVVSNRPNVGQGIMNNVMPQQQHPSTIQNNQPPHYNEFNSNHERGRGNAEYSSHYQYTQPRPGNMQGPMFTGGGNKNFNVHPSVAHGGFRPDIVSQPHNNDRVQFTGQGNPQFSRKRQMDFKGPSFNKKVKPSVMSRLGPRSGGLAKSPQQKSLASRLGPKGRDAPAAIKKLTKEESSKLAAKYSDFPVAGLFCNMCNQHKFASVFDYLRHQDTMKHNQRAKSVHLKINATYKYLLSEAQLAYMRKMGEENLNNREERLCELCEVPYQSKGNKKGGNHMTVKECAALHQYVNPKGCCQCGKFSSRLFYENHCSTIGHLKKVYTSKLKKESKMKIEKEKLDKYKIICETGSEIAEEENKPRIKIMHNTLAKHARVYEQFGKDPIPKEVELLLEAYEVKEDTMSWPRKFPFDYFEPSYPHGKLKVIFDTDFECGVCCTVLERSKQGIIDHCSTKEHYDNVLKKQEKVKNMIEKEDLEGEDEQPVKEEGKNDTLDATEESKLNKKEDEEEEKDEEDIDIYDDPYEGDNLFVEEHVEGGEGKDDDAAAAAACDDPKKDDDRMDDDHVEGVEEDALDYEDELDFEVCDSEQPKVKKGKPLKSQAKADDVKTEPSGL